MEVTVDTKKRMRKWNHVEKYQNTTLRYTPGKDFPKAMEEVIGRPEIIRLFVTLDEVWDYRTKEYHWNYIIGHNPYVGDEKHYHYDWPLTEPSPWNIHEEDYLTSHAECADSVLLNVRRYEREVMEGVITLEQYAEVFKTTVAHYKNLIPNIRYIEVGNEVEIPNFGNLTMSEYYMLYQVAAKAIQELNCEHAYEVPLLVGGFGMSAGMTNWKYWDEFLTLLAEDDNRIIDFYSMHEYHTDSARILEFYVRHEAGVKGRNLPDLPLMMSEYGLRVGIGDAGRPHNLQNASGEISGLLLGSYCPQLKMFPWCTFHNPNQQLGRTMFLSDEHKDYIPTPSGHVMTMFSMMQDDEVLIEGYCEHQAVATASNNVVCILMANPGLVEKDYELNVLQLDKGDYRVEEYMVDEEKNNCLFDMQQKQLTVTHSMVLKDEIEFHTLVHMRKESFCLYKIIPIS